MPKPIAAAGVVFACGTDGCLHTFDALSGEELGSFETGSTTCADPLLHNGTIYIGGRDGCLYALDAMTGAERWRHETGGEISSPPAVPYTVREGRKVYVASADGCLYALDERTGREAWRFQAGGEIRSAPLLHNDDVVFLGSDDGTIHAVSAEDGAARWESQTGDVGRSSALSVDEGIIYRGNDSGVLCAHDVTTGSQMSVFETGHDWLLSSPRLAALEGIVYFGKSSTVYAIDVKTHKQLWKRRTGLSDRWRSGGRNTFVAYRSGFVRISNGSDLYSLDVTDGSQQWVYEMNGEPISPITDPVRDMLVFADSGGYLHTVDAMNGGDAK